MCTHTHTHTHSGVSRILYRGVLDSLRAKKISGHASQLKNVRYYNTLVGVVYSLVCNIKIVNDTRIYSLFRHVGKLILSNDDKALCSVFIQVKQSIAKKYWLRHNSSYY